MKRLRYLAIAFLLFFSTAFAQTKAQQKTKVLLLGTFHFDNPGLDVAKYENANVLSPKRQQEIADVVMKLKQFRPDKIFVEQEPAAQPRLDSLLNQYKENRWTLYANEIYQLGFRLAKELQLPTLHAVDYRAAAFPFDSLGKVAAGAKQYSLLQRLKTTIDSIQTAFNSQLQTSTIRQILLQENNAANQRFSVGGYFDFLVAGGKDNHVGSYLVSEWWRRNMVIYENILKRLDGNEKNVLVIFGSSHTALLKEFMKFNPNIELVDVATLLK
jgi:hypothetical protein